MDAQPNCFVSGMLAAVLRLSRFAGIAPLRFVKKRTGWQIFPCPSWNIYGYFLIATFNLLNIGTIISELLLHPEDTIHMRTKTRCMVWIVQITLTMATAGTAVRGATKQMQNIIACLNQMQKINSDLNIHHWPKSLKKLTMLIFWVIVTLALALVDYVATIWSAYHLKAETWVSEMNLFYYCCYWIMQLCEMQFVMITLHVKDIFSAVNDSLRSLLCELADHNTLIPLNEGPFYIEEFTRRTNNINSSNNSGRTYSEIFVKPPNSHHKSVRRLAQAYISICNVVRDVDRCHGLIVLMTMASLLLHLVCTPYYFITNLFEVSASQNSVTQHILNILQLFWCIFHTFNLVMIIEPCHSTHMEMEMTRELVSHLMSCSNSNYEPLAVELNLFFMHLVLNEVSYKPLNVIAMTRGLVVTILGSITTYLVVIIQLSFGHSA